MVESNTLIEATKAVGSHKKAKRWRVFEVGERISAGKDRNCSKSHVLIELNNRLPIGTRADVGDGIYGLL